METQKRPKKLTGIKVKTQKKAKWHFSKTFWTTNFLHFYCNVSLINDGNRPIVSYFCALFRTIFYQKWDIIMVVSLFKLRLSVERKYNEDFNWQIAIAFFIIFVIILAIVHFTFPFISEFSIFILNYFDYINTLW